MGQRGKAGVVRRAGQQKKQGTRGVLDRIQKANVAALRLAGDDGHLMAGLGQLARYEDDDDDPLDHRHEEARDNHVPTGVSSRRAFGAHLRQAINESDVVIEVLDARDPNGYRSRAVEQEVLCNGKVLVLLLNKIDLIDDQQVVERWQQFLQRSHPCVVFRSMTTGSRSKKSSIKFVKERATRLPAAVLESGYQPLGASDLMNLLKNYTRADRESAETEAPPAAAPQMVEGEDGEAAPAAKQPLFKSIVVSVIGMPNVGKSSVINSLCRNTRKLKTGNEPGVTRHLGRVKLTENIMLIDTPGVIADGSDGDPASILRGCAKPTTDDTIVDCVNLLLEKIPARLAEFYGMEMEGLTAEKLLTQLAVSRGLIRPGGYRDLVSAGRVVIEDWRNGRFRFWAEAPVAPTSAGRIQIIAEPSAALNL